MTPPVSVVELRRLDVLTALSLTVSTRLIVTPEFPPPAISMATGLMILSSAHLARIRLIATGITIADVMDDIELVI